MERLSESIGQDTLPLLLTYAILGDGLDLEQLKKTIRTKLPPKIDDFDAAFHGLLEAGYWKDNSIVVVRPDVLAAAFAVLALRAKGQTQSAIPSAMLWWSLSNKFAAKGLAPLERLMHDAETVLGMGDEGEGVPSLWLEGLVDHAIAEDRFDVLVQIDTFSQHQATPGFRKSVINARECLMEYSDDEGAKARHLTNLSVDYPGAGRDPEALDASSEAVSIYRRLAADNPARFDPDLASSLNNCSIRLSVAVRNPEALEAIAEAVDIHRRLAADNPVRFEPDLAMSLNNWAADLSREGRNPESLEASEESVEIYRRLAEDNPARFEPDLASSLNNWSSRLSDAGRNPEALEASAEAVEIYRRLAADNPARFEPDLASGLNNWSNRLSDAGRNPEALDAIVEAAAIHRRLAADTPARFEPDLAMSLGTRGTVLRALGQFDEARESFQEGAAIIRPQVEENSEGPNAALLRKLEADANDTKA